MTSVLASTIIPSCCSMPSHAWRNAGVETVLEGSRPSPAMRPLSPTAHPDVVIVDLANAGRRLGGLDVNPPHAVA